MFNIENEYQNHKPEIEFTEIEGYNINGEKIENSGNGLKMAILGLLLLGGGGYLGYNYMQNQNSSEVEKSAVMGVSKVNPLDRDEIEQELDEIHQEVEKRENVNEKIKDVVDNFIDNKKPSYASKDEISSKIDGMVDMFYNKEAIPTKLDDMVDDFYSNQSSNQDSRIITIKEGDTLAKISKRFYGNSMEYQRIIDANERLQKSHTLHIGEKIRVPY